MSIQITFAPDLDNREQGLLELTHRLAYRPTADLFSTPPSFCVGFMPEGFPADVQLPQEHRIIGAVTWAKGLIHLFVDVKHSPDEAVRFYTEHLSPDNWPKVHPMAHAGLHPDLERNLRSVVFCGGPSGPELQVTAWGHGREPTDLRLAFGPKSGPGLPGLCHELADDPQRTLRRRTPFWPRITPPPGTWESFAGTNQGFETMSHSARLETDRTASDIMDYCGSQLEQSGWHRLGVFTHESSLITHWLSADPLGSAVVALLHVISPELTSRTRFLLLFVQRLGDPTLTA